MASYRASQPPPSSQKKQASISSFFTPKSQPKQPASSPIRDVNDEGPLFENANIITQAREQRLSHSVKRVIDDGDSEIENYEPPRKRSRIPSDSPTIAGHDRLSSPTADPGKTKLTLGQEKRSDSIPKSTDRTARYVFSSSPVRVEDDGDEEAQIRKQRLHEKFVKRLGRPDSIAEIKRRNRLITEETQEDAEGEEDDEEQEPAPKPQKGRAGAAAKAKKLTPLDQQVVDLKRAHMDTLLVVEVGYKYRLYGEDARIAAKELGIVCIPGKYRFDEHASEAHLDRFAGASFPTHRLHVHVKRLVQAGHKVGIVRQMETAALKAVSATRNQAFTRKLTNVYTKATYVDDIEALDGGNSVGGALATGFLLCLTETTANFGFNSDEKVHVGFIAVQPATGDIIYDDFEDGFMRSEIETRLLHLAPSEFLIVGDLSKATDKLVKHLAGSKLNVFGDQSRLERVPKPKSMAAEAFSNVTRFYAEEVSQNDSAPGGNKTVMLDKVHTLTEHVTICLSAMIGHLKEYGLENVFALTKNFQPFSARSHMLLNGNTLTSLEVYQNQTDHGVQGSLFWTMDRTKTRFGRRLLRKWIGRPLLDKAKLEERISAVEELKQGDHTNPVHRLKSLLAATKVDLEKSLIRIYYGKASRPELLNVLQSLQRISNEYMHLSSTSPPEFASTLLNESVTSLPKIHGKVIEVLERINLQAAKDDDKYAFFREEHETEAIRDHSLSIAAVEGELDEHRKDAGEKIGKKKVDYVTVAGIEYLIEVGDMHIKKVPASWQKISGTKKLSRFHTPEVKRMIRERDQHKESLAAACDAAYKELLGSLSTHYQEFRDCVQSLATLDCLLSLADLAGSPGYVKPTFTSETRIEVKQGRHPMVEQLLLDAYVPNDISLDSSDRALLITGPNMGGKSSYVRQVALICIMGQIGSYVPAESASLGMLDAVFTRMGAFDNMMSGESTFMVELSETADILKQATPRSLVILDELGRGTSTHDGVAIAEAVLRHVVTDTKCLTAFITHYQHLASLESSLGGALRNVHMSFRAEKGEEGVEDDITFLYEVVNGVAHRSYGLNVARLADVPKSVIDIAAEKSKELEGEMKAKKLSHVYVTVWLLYSHNADNPQVETSRQRAQRK